MIKRYCLSIKTPMGQQVIPQVFAEADINSAIESLAAQGVDKRNICVKIDIELEDGEYEISEVK